MCSMEGGRYELLKLLCETRIRLESYIHRPAFVSSAFTKISRTYAHSREFRVYGYRNFLLYRKVSSAVRQFRLMDSATCVQLQATILFDDFFAKNNCVPRPIFPIVLIVIYFHYVSLKFEIIIRLIYGRWIWRWKRSFFLDDAR